MLGVVAKVWFAATRMVEPLENTEGVDDLAAVAGRRARVARLAVGLVKPALSRRIRQRRQRTMAALTLHLVGTRIVRIRTASVKTARFFSLTATPFA